MNQNITILLNGQKQSQSSLVGSKTSDGRRKIEIASRLFQSERALYSKKSLLITNSISLDIWKKFVKGFIWSMVLYVYETWRNGTE